MAFASFSANAQTVSSKFDSDPKFRKKLMSQYRVTLDRAKLTMGGLLRQSENARDLEVLDKLDVEMTLKWDPLHVVTFHDNGTYKIEIDIGVLAYNIELLKAYMIDIENKSLAARSDFLRSQYESLNGQIMNTEYSFSKYFTTEQEFSNFHENPEIIDYLLSMSDLIVLGMLYHEYCHNTLGHTLTPLLIHSDKINRTRETKESFYSKSVLREIEADKCADDYLSRAGLSMLPTFILGNSTRILVDQYNSRNEILGNFTSHPISRDRIQEAFNSYEEAFKVFNSKLPHGQKVSIEEYEASVQDTKWLIDFIYSIGDNKQ